MGQLALIVFRYWQSGSYI